MDAREITQSVSMQDIVKNTAPATNRKNGGDENMQVDEDHEVTLSEGGGKHSKFVVKTEKRANGNYSVLEIDDSPILFHQEYK